MATTSDSPLHLVSSQQRLPPEVKKLMAAPRLSAARAWQALAGTNESYLPAKQLKPLFLGVRETRGKCSALAGFFRSPDGTLHEILAERKLEQLRGENLFEALPLEMLASPRVELAQVKRVLDPLWGKNAAEQIFVLLPQSLLPVERAPKGAGVWMCVSVERQQAHLALVSAHTGRLHLFARAHFFKLAGRTAAIVIKFVILAAIFAYWYWFFAGGPWGQAALALSIALLIIAILIEIYLANKAAAGGGGAGGGTGGGTGGGSGPGPGGGGGGGGGDGDNYYETLKKLKKRAEDLKKKLDERAEKHDKFDPLDPDNREEKEIFDDLNKTLEEAGKDGSISPEDQKDLQKDLDKAKDMLPK